MKKVLISTRTLNNGSEFQFDALERGFFKMFRDWDITALHNKRNQNFSTNPDGDLTPSGFFYERFSMCFRSLNALLCLQQMPFVVVNYHAQRISKF